MRGVERGQLIQRWAQLDASSSVSLKEAVVPPLLGASGKFWLCLPVSSSGEKVAGEGRGGDHGVWIQAAAWVSGTKDQLPTGRDSLLRSLCTGIFPVSGCHCC